MSAADAKRTAESAELRKTQADRPESQQPCGFASGEGCSMNCGKSAEEMRKPMYLPSLNPPGPPLCRAGVRRPQALVAAVAPYLVTSPAGAEKCGASLTPQPPNLPALALRVCEPEPGAANRGDAGAVVLTHPAFDRPPVHNERRRGLKKGTVSLAVVRRRRAYAEAQAAQAARRATPARDVVAESMRPAVPLVDAAGAGLVAAALRHLAEGLRKPGAVMDSPQRVREFVTLHLGRRDTEGFAVMFLDTQLTLIEFAVMFEGTLSQTMVYPREVVRRALALNARAVILAHNHPSGVPEPSRADEFLTNGLKSALDMVDVRVLDHLVVGGTLCVSFAERGML